VRTVFGWHLILVEARDPARPATDEEWQQRLRSRLAAEELALQIQKLIDNSRKNAKIVIYLGG
jgi:parvulin-like peptidyl-prolyl isomerase